MDEQLRGLVERLEAIAGELDEIAFERLREAVAEGTGQRPVEDKRLMQARRAIDKAIGVLGQLGEAGGDSAT